MGGGVGFLAFTRCVGVHTLDVRDLDWIPPGGIDPSVHLIGWHLFRSSPWGFPPGVTSDLGYPIGTSVALTDSIPLLALPFKAISPFLPHPFQYFGPWLLACFVLQGVFGSLLMSTVTNRTTLRALGAALFVLAPILSHRLGHAALSAHWLLLAALWLNRRAAASGLDRRAHVRWAVLVLAASATHPYLTVMVLAIAGATFLGQVTTARHIVTSVVLPCAVLGLITFAVWWTAGYFIVPGDGTLQASGFGRLSMNLLSPLIPREGAWTFGRIPLTTAQYDQHEGFSYLGLGVFTLLVVSVPLLRPWRTNWLTRPNLALLVTLAGLTMFALSPTVTFGPSTIFQYDAGWWGPLATFRASGRMFWPAVYALMFGVISLVVRRLPARVAVLALTVAVGLQAADVAGVYRLKRAGFALRFDNPLRSIFWRTLPGHYRHLVMYPSNMCVPPEQAMDYRPLALVAGTAGLTFNGGYAARYDADAVGRYCAHLTQDIQQGVFSDDTLYVVTSAEAPLLLASPMPLACVPVDGLVVCARGAS